MAAASGNQSMELQHYMRDVAQALRSGDMTRACRIGAEAVARGIENIQLLTLASYDQINRGDNMAALELALRARRLNPRSVDVLTVAALCFSRLGRHREAVEAYDAALKQTPAAVTLRFSKARALEDMSELTRARREFERVVDAQPTHAAALAHLANLAAGRGDAKAARDYGTRALKSNPGEIAATLALASADIEDGHFDDALVRLKPVVENRSCSPVNRSIAEGLAGDAFDGLGRTDEAFTAYSGSKAALRALYQPQFEAPGLETAQARVARFDRYFRAAPKDMWCGRKSDVAAGELRAHVFLVGFPRSGTTLLEQVLASHRDVVTMEERDCLIDAANDFLVQPEGLSRLAAMQGAALDAWRDAYWKRVAEAGVAPGRGVFVDKMPLNTVLLCLVAKLFPRAKIVFALRDPRDVVLSCFRRRFGMTAQMYELITLEGAAFYYDAVMTLAQVYRGQLGLDIHDFRYESMVADFEGEMRKVCAFLGIEWDEEMRGFAERTRAKGIDTPSAAQVARGLYTQGAGQWRRYAAHLSPVLAMLEPWLARYGYQG